MSQTRGSFESPQFNRGFGFSNVADYEQSVQPIVKSGEYGVNYSSYDFSPLLRAAQPGVAPAHGLFHLTVEGVRPRIPADGVAAAGSPDQDWIGVTPVRVSKSGNRHRRASATSYPLGDRLEDQRFILVTDLGLIMKESVDGSRVIYVQSFSGQGPVEGVEISVLSKNGTVLKNATTNPMGKAELPSLRGLQWEKVPVALVARKGDDLAFIPWAKSDRYLETSRFNVGGISYNQKSALVASLFTERGIYRPGEPINVGGIVRQLDWSGDLAGMPVNLVVLNAKRDVAGRYPLPAES
ncbi:MAG: hypothetical protein ACI8UZ_003517 [Akkermansiaceae bacterium]